MLGDWKGENAQYMWIFRDSTLQRTAIGELQNPKKSLIMQMKCCVRALIGEAGLQVGACFLSV
jgi:hypothetical protein